MAFYNGNDKIRVWNKIIHAIHSKSLFLSGKLNWKETHTRSFDLSSYGSLDCIVKHSTQLVTRFLFFICICESYLWCSQLCIVFRSGFFLWFLSLALSLFCLPHKPFWFWNVSFQMKCTIIKTHEMQKVETVKEKWMRKEIMDSTFHDELAIFGDFLWIDKTATTATQQRNEWQPFESRMVFMR